MWAPDPAPGEDCTSGSRTLCQRPPVCQDCGLTLHGNAATARGRAGATCLGRDGYLLPPLLAPVLAGSEALPAAEAGTPSCKLTAYAPARSPAFSSPPLPRVISRGQSASGWLSPDPDPCASAAAPSHFLPYLLCPPALPHPPSPNPTLFLGVSLDPPLSLFLFSPNPHFPSPSLWPCCHHDSWGSPSPQPLLPPRPGRRGLGGILALLRPRQGGRRTDGTG